MWKGKEEELSVLSSCFDLLGIGFLCAGSGECMCNFAIHGKWAGNNY